MMYTGFCVSLSSPEYDGDVDLKSHIESTTLKVRCNSPFESLEEEYISLSFQSRHILYDREDVPQSSEYDSVSLRHGVFQHKHSDLKSQLGSVPSDNCAVLVFSSDESEPTAAQQRWGKLFAGLRGICYNEPSLLLQARDEWLCDVGSKASTDGELFSTTGSCLDGECSTPPQCLRGARLRYASAVRDTIFNALCSASPLENADVQQMPYKGSGFQRRCKGAEQQSPSCENTSASDHPFSFALVYYSQAFGLLFFCRDTIGLAPLLFGAFSKTLSTDGTVHECTSLAKVAVASSARDMRLLGQLDLRQGSSVAHQLTEVPVTGVWVVDLWTWYYLNFVRRVWKQDDACCGGRNDGLCFHKGVTGCIMWKEQSPLLDLHTWCECECCKASRESYWTRRTCEDSSCSLFSMHSPADILFQRCEACMICTLCKEVAFAVHRSVPEIFRSMHALFCKSECANSLGYSETILNQTSLLEEDRGLRQLRKRGDNGTLFVGVLFSGGLDSTLLVASLLLELARYMHISNEDQDLSQYTCPGIGGANVSKPAKLQCSGNSTVGRVVVELVTVGFSTEAPDRLTALRSFEDILALLGSLDCRNEHNTRSAAPNASLETSKMHRDVEFRHVAKVGQWELEVRLVAVDVDAAAVEAERVNILEAIAPQKSHMDFNIATPLYFALRGRGYLVSPQFDKRPEWLQLRKCESLWEPLVIGKHVTRDARKGNTSDGENAASYIGESLNSECDAFTAISAGETGITPDGVSEKGRCAVCQHKAKQGCVHRACKLCCGKLCRFALERSVLMGDMGWNNQNASPEFSGTIHIGRVGHIPVHLLGLKVSAQCLAHRVRPIHNSVVDTEPPRGYNKAPSIALKPFASLLNAPCGIDLVEKSGCRPFYAMKEEEVQRQAEFDASILSNIEEGIYIVQSRILLAGSGADELFGGYGRHRTAKQKRDSDAARTEQLLDIRRLWLRNLGRDGRVASLFGRKTRLPFLDPFLLTFVCRRLSFDMILNPVPEAEDVMQKVLNIVLTRKGAGESSSGTPQDMLLPVERFSNHGPFCGFETTGECRNKGIMDLVPSVGTNALASGGKWLLRMCAIHRGVLFCSCARKRAIQFGTRSAKMSNSIYFSSNRSARGDTPLPM